VRNTREVGKITRPRGKLPGNREVGTKRLLRGQGMGEASGLLEGEDEKNIGVGRSGWVGDIKTPQKSPKETIGGS